MPRSYGMVLQGMQWSVLNLGDDIPRSECSVRNLGHGIAGYAMACPESGADFSELGMGCRVLGHRYQCMKDSFLG